MNRKKFIYEIWFAYIMFYVCFKHLFINDNFLYVILDVLFFAVVLKAIPQEIKIKCEVWWLFYLFLVIDMFFSAFYGLYFQDAIKFSVVYLNFLIITLFFAQLTDWQEIFFKWIKIGCLFHLFFTYFSIFFTNQALKITAQFLTKETQAITARWANEFHIYAGISGQTGTNAFFFSVLVGVFLSELRTNSKNKWHIKLLLFSSWIGMVFTGKKGLIIAAILSTMVIYWVTGNGTIKRWILASGGIMLFGISALAIVFRERIYNMFYISVFTRLKIGEGMLSAILNHPIGGSGVNSIGAYTYDGHLGHNIYLQIWVEQGIIGLIILLIALSIPLYLTYIKVKNNTLYGNHLKTNCYSLFMQVFIIIYGFFGNPIYDYNIIITFLLSLAAGFADECSYNKNKKIKTANLKLM